MTDRYNGFFVTLEADVRSDDAEPILNAIRQIRGVLDVRPNVRSIEQYVVEQRVRREFEIKIIEALRENGDG